MKTDTKQPSLKDLIGKSIGSAQQEMIITLPGRILRAFVHKLHERDLDPETKQPFTSFYRWLWVMPPPGCGLCSSHYLDADDIIHQLKKSRMRLPENERGPMDALIEDLVKGHGAAKKRGGDRCSAKAKEDQSVSTNALNGTMRHSRSRSPGALAARLAESTEPKLRAAWQGYLDGKHRSVTAAAIACGLVEDSNAPLNRLKQNWKKASKADRKAFLAWIEKAGDT